MIDLNYKPKPKATDSKNEDTPMGILILSLSPFAFLFWLVITASFLHGIY